MRVLLVALYFPPENMVASLRTGHFARALIECGHEVTVLTRQPSNGDLAHLASDLAACRVLAVADPSEGVRSRVDGKLLLDGRLGGKMRRAWWRAALRRVAKSTARALLPDRHVVWAWRALRGARHLDSEPDIVLASVPTMSVLMVASRLAKRWNVPFVLDYRDSLTNDPYNPLAPVMLLIHRFLERRWSQQVAAITSVSEPLTRELATSLGVPGSVVMNGFDQRDFPPHRCSGAVGSTLVISHCGYLHAGKRDPEPLFAAIHKLAGSGINNIHINFFGANTEILRPLVEKYDLENSIQLGPLLKHQESVEVQAHSDILLYLSWNSPLDVGVYSGKLFEYVGSRRPVLMIGYEGGVAASLVRDRELGLVSNDPDEIADAVRRWAEHKTVRGMIPAVEMHRWNSEYSRQYQARVMVQLLEESVRGRGLKPATPRD